MAFDIYVGGFARFYTMNWENVTQKWARESGTSYQIIGPDGPPEPAEWNEAFDAARHWITAINEGLGDNLSEPIDWDETLDAPYFTDRPGYDAYGALMVWAAHAELGSTPPEKYDGEWYSDDAFTQASEPKKGQKYRAITCGSLWIPGDFEFSFDFKDLVSNDVHICSNGALLADLKRLNEDTFQMSDIDREAVLQAEFEEDLKLADLARLGLSLMLDLAGKSVEHRLPIMMST